MAVTDRYIELLKKLLPPGFAWPRGQSSVIHKLFAAMAEEMARFDARLGTDLLNEADPSTSLELLEDWERVVALPDDCQLTLSETVGGRRADVLRKLASRGGQSRKFFIDMAKAFNYTVAIDEIHPFRAGRARSGDRAYDIDWIHHWRVIADSAVASYFRAGAGRCGDRLRTWKNTTLECVITDVKPAHTVVHFVYKET